MVEARRQGPVERTTRAELRSLGVPLATSTRAATAVNLARRLDDQATTGAAAIAKQLDALMADVRSLRIPAPEVGPADPAVEPEDAVAKARRAREARRAGA